MIEKNISKLYSIIDWPCSFWQGPVSTVWAWNDHRFRHRCARVVHHRQIWWFCPCVIFRQSICFFLGSAESSGAGASSSWRLCIALVTKQRCGLQITHRLDIVILISCNETLGCSLFLSCLQGSWLSTEQLFMNLYPPTLLIMLSIPAIFQNALFCFHRRIQ